MESSGTVLRVPSPAAEAASKISVASAEHGTKTKSNCSFALLLALCSLSILSSLWAVSYVRRSLNKPESPELLHNEQLQNQTEAPKPKKQSAPHNILNSVDNRASMLMRPDAAQILANDVDAWLEKSPAADILYMSVDDYKYDPIIDTTWVSKYALKTWPDFMLKYYNSTGDEKAAYMDNLIEARILGPDYPSPALRGQRGVFSKVFLPKDHILGIYVGIVMKDGIEESQSFDMRAETEWLRTLDPNIRPGDIGRYAFEVPLAQKSEYEGDTLITSALNRGNILCLVNSYWAPPEEPDENSSRYNVGTAALRINAHIPVIAFYAVRDIPAGQELLTDYGKGYWEDSDDLDESHMVRIALPTNRFLTDVDNFSEPWVQPLPNNTNLETVIAELQTLGLSDFCVGDNRVETTAEALTKAMHCPHGWFSRTNTDRYKCCGISW